MVYYFVTVYFVSQQKDWKILPEPSVKKLFEPVCFNPLKRFCRSGVVDQNEAVALLEDVLEEIFIFLLAGSVPEPSRDLELDSDNGVLLIDKSIVVTFSFPKTEERYQN